MARRGLCLAVATAALTAVPLGALEVPFLAGRVNDRAGLLDEATRQRLETSLAELERSTGAQVAVLTIESLDGEPLEGFSLRVVETWKLGRKGVDDGVLLLVVHGDRRMRLEVGYGLEERLPDALAGRILDRVMAPRFRSADYGGGIEAGVAAVAAAIRGDEGEVLAAAVSSGSGSSSSGSGSSGSGSSGSGIDPIGRWLGMGIFTLVVGTFSSIALLTRGGGSWFLYFFLMPFYLAFPAAFVGIRFAAVLFALWVVGFPLFKLLLGRTGWGRRFVAEHPGWTSTWSSSRGWSSGGGGGFSGGGFSGGGGSFGGGGASGSW